MLLISCSHFKNWFLFDGIFKGGVRCFSFTQTCMVTVKRRHWDINTSITNGYPLYLALSIVTISLTIEFYFNKTCWLKFIVLGNYAFVFSDILKLVELVVGFRQFNFSVRQAKTE